MTRKIIITETDKTRLQKIISSSFQHSFNGKEYIRKLEAELDKAKVVLPGRIPPNVVTMNSKVLLSIGESEEEVSYTLVYPEDEDFINNKLSVLAPIGTAILGYKEGDIVEWAVPSGIEKIRLIKMLYQPESSGDFTL